MSIAHKRRWIIEDLRDRYSVASIAKRRGVSEAMVIAVWAEWSAQRKLLSDSRRWKTSKYISRGETRSAS